MQRLQAFRYQLMPNGEQQRDMRRFAGACRFVYNQGLALQQERHQQGEKKLSAFALNNLLPLWKKNPDTAWLAQVPSQTLQQSLKDLDSAYQNFFDKRAAFPKFKKKGQSESFRFPQGFEIDAPNNRIKLPKLGWVRYRNSCDIVGKPKNITISQKNGKWFASIQTEREVEPPIPTATTAIGIDMGIARFATFSDSDFIAPLCSFKKHERRLAKYQRRMSRKVKFSKNWHKAKRKIQQIHSTIANTRKDFLHKTTTTISKNHAFVVIEDLQVRNMSKSANGKNVAAKSGLNKAILDQAWFEFRRQLEYKLAWNGGILVAVPAHYTSQTCPECGHVAKENRQSQAKFQCVDCGYENHADVVGAINVLERGLRLFACGEDIRRQKVVKPRRAASMKQEPTEATALGFAPDAAP